MIARFMSFYKPGVTKMLHSSEVAYKSGVRPRKLGTAPLVLAFAKTLTSHSPYSTKWDYILLELFFSPNGVLRVEVWAAFYSPPRWVA